MMQIKATNTRNMLSSIGHSRTKILDPTKGPPYTSEHAPSSSWTAGSASMLASVWRPLA